MEYVRRREVWLWCCMLVLCLFGCGDSTEPDEGNALLVGVWRYEDPSAAAQALSSTALEPSEVEAREQRLGYTRFVFCADGTMTRTPTSPWLNARWVLKGNLLTITSDRFSDAPGPVEYRYEVKGDRLIDLESGVALSLRRADDSRGK